MTRPTLDGLRLVASDYDGTLALPDREISARNRAALRELVDAGLHFAVITGRPPRFAGSIVDKAGVPTTLICSNGAVVYDPVDDVVLSSDNIDHGAALEVIAEVRDRHPDAAMSVELGVDFVGEARFSRLMGREPSAELHDIAEHVDDRAHKLIIALPDPSAPDRALGPDATMELIAPVVGDRFNMTHAGLPFIELAAPGVSKARGLARLAAELGVAASECIVFGDMPNDVPMLEWAGWGVAMANAHDDTLAAADEVTAANTDDGVAQVLEALLAPRANPEISSAEHERRV